MCDICATEFSEQITKIKCEKCNNTQFQCFACVVNNDFLCCYCMNEACLADNLITYNTSRISNFNAWKDILLKKYKQIFDNNGLFLKSYAKVISDVTSYHTKEYAKKILLYLFDKTSMTDNELIEAYNILKKYCGNGYEQLVNLQKRAPDEYEIDVCNKFNIQHPTNVTELSVGTYIFVKINDETFINKKKIRYTKEDADSDEKSVIWSLTRYLIGPLLENNTTCTCNKICCENCNNKYCKNCLSTEHVRCNLNLDNEILNKIKLCPVCKQLVEKIDGCDDMWCISCKVFFSWRQGIIRTDNPHNPDHIEYINKDFDKVEDTKQRIKIAFKHDYVENLYKSILKMDWNVLVEWEILSKIKKSVAEYLIYIDSTKRTFTIVRTMIDVLNKYSKCMTDLKVSKENLDINFSNAVIINLKRFTISYYN